jgi:hypothetical protein
LNLEGYNDVLEIGPVFWQNICWTNQSIPM